MAAPLVGQVKMLNLAFRHRIRNILYPGLDLHTRNRASLCRFWNTGPRDVLDAETIAIRQRGALDWRYIETNLQPLAEVKDQPEIMAAFEKLKRGR